MEDQVDQPVEPVTEPGTQPAAGTDSPWYRRVDLAISVALLIIGIATIVLADLTIAEARGYTADPIGPRGFAFMIGGFLAVGGAALLVTQIVRTRRGHVGPDEEAEVAGDDPRYPASTRRALTIMVLTIGFAAALEPVGYLLATVLHIAGCLWAMGTRRVTKLVVFPVVYAIVTFALFDPLLGVRLPDGILHYLLDRIGVR